MSTGATIGSGIAALILLGATAALISSLPELRRYFRIRRM